MALGLVGACFQTLFANPLATPSTVGTTAGATLGALVALVFVTLRPLENNPLPLWDGAHVAGPGVRSAAVRPPSEPSAKPLQPPSFSHSPATWNSSRSKNPSTSSGVCTG